MTRGIVEVPMTMMSGKNTVISAAMSAVRLSLNSFVPIRYTTTGSSANARPPAMAMTL